MSRSATSTTPESWAKRKYVALRPPVDFADPSSTTKPASASVSTRIATADREIPVSRANSGRVFAKPDLTRLST